MTGTVLARKNRNRTEPNRFGDRGSFNDSKNGNESSDEPFGDDSMEDKNYSPPNKKQKIQNDELDPDDEIDDLELNGEFDKIKTSLANETSALERKQSAQELECEKNPVVQSLVVDNKLLQQLFANSLEILARVSMIEESLITRKILSSIQHDRNFEQSEQFKSFIENKLPLMSLKDLESFEQKLSDVEFAKKAVSISID